MFFGATALLGMVLLVAALVVRWKPKDVGWRAALFSAGFGLAVTGGLAPLGGPLTIQFALVVAAAAQFFVGLSALSHRHRL